MKLFNPPDLDSFITKSPVLPLAKIGKVLNRPHYVEEAKRQFLIHIKYLFDTKTGLFFHGWTFEDGGHNFAKALWGRGNR